ARGIALGADGEKRVAAEAVVLGAGHGHARGKRLELGLGEGGPLHGRERRQRARLEPAVADRYPWGVPGANVLADVAAKHAGHDAAPQLLGNRALVLDRLVRETKARVHHPRRGKRACRAAPETALARAAERLAVAGPRASPRHHTTTPTHSS